MVQQMKYNSGYDVAGEEDPTNRVFINTETTYRTGKFFFRNLATGARIRFDIPDYGGTEYDDDKVITYPAGLLAADVPIFADTPAVIKNKSIDIANGNTFSNIVNANIAANAGIVYSKLNLTGTIVNADINASAGIVDSKLAQITNKAKLPSSTVYNDQANTYNSSFQTFIKGYLRLDDLAGHYTALDNGTQTGNFAAAIPTLAANDTFAMRGLANVFSTFQKIQYSGSSGLVLYRPDNTPGNGAGTAFNLQNNGAAEATYAAIYGVISTNTAGVEDGAISLQTKKAGVLGEKMSVSKDGIIAFGDAFKATISAAALSQNRALTLADAGGRIVLNTFDNAFSAQQTITVNNQFPLTMIRPLNTVGTVIGIAYGLMQDSGSNNTVYSKIESRIGTNTDGNETGFLDFYTMKNGTLGQYGVWDGTQLSIGLSGARVVLDAVGMSSSRTFTFPDAAGQVTVNTVAQTLTSKTLTSPVINAGALNGGFTGNAALVFTRTAVASSAEAIQIWKVSDDATSYIQVDNASASDGLFSPRITSYNAGGTAGLVGLYQYANVAAGSDAASSSNAIMIFDVRRSDATAIVTRDRLFQFRNAGTNILEINRANVNFLSLPMANAILNVDTNKLKHSTTNADGDLYVYDTTYGGAIRLPRGSNGDVLKSTAGSVAWGANIISVADLNDIGNVNTDTAANGNILQFNGTTWVNSTIGTNGEANTAANSGAGAGTFKDKTAAQLNFRSLLAVNANIVITQNTNDISIGLPDTITLPAAAATKFVFLKPVTTGASENLVAFRSADDSTGSELLIANATTSDTAFIPLMWFKGYGSSGNAGVIIAETTAALDTGTNAVMVIDTRRTGAALTTRPMLELRNYTTQEYLFKIDGFDMKGNNLENAVITSTVTGIVDANIGGAAAIATSKLAAAATFAFKNAANIFTLLQTNSLDADTTQKLYRPNNTAAIYNGIDFDFNNSTPVQTTYAQVLGVLGSPTAGAENGSIYFNTKLAGVMATRMAINHNGNLFIGTNLRLILSESGLTAARTILFPDSSTTLVGTSDSRLSDARTPTTHASTHQLGSTDPFSLTGFKSARKVVSTTSNTLSATADNQVDVDAATAGGNVTLTLPAASGNTGLVYWIQKIDSGSNTVIIDANASETINGALTYTLTAQYQIVMLRCNGTNWTTGPYSTERRGKSTGTANGSATSFAMPHGLGGVPHDVILRCSSHSGVNTYSYDATNITVVFAVAPSAGSIVFEWSAVP